MSSIVTSMSHKKAFCLVEMAITLTLLLFIAMLSIPFGSYMRHICVRAEIEKLAMICRSLQAQAVMDHAEHSIVFDYTKQQFTHDDIIEMLPKGVSFGIIPGSKGPPATPHKTLEKPITFKENKIIFHPDGIIQPGAVYLIADDRRVMYALSSCVAPYSYVRIYQYNGSWQQISG